MTTRTTFERFSVLIALLAFGVVFISAAAAQGGTVGYLGQDTSTLANWRTPATDKPAAFDPSGDDVYGSNGYYVAFWSGTGSSIAVQQSLPSYVSGVSPKLSGTYAYGGYAALNNPSAGTQPTNLASGLWHQGSGTGELDLFDITLSDETSFVLGVIYNTHDATSYNPVGMRARQKNGTANTGMVSISHSAGAAYYQFFSVSGVAGDIFTVSAQGGGGAVTVSGLTFETPEPSAAVLLLSGGCLGLLGCLWRRRQG